MSNSRVILVNPQIRTSATAPGAVILRCVVAAVGLLVAIVVPDVAGSSWLIPFLIVAWLACDLRRVLSGLNIVLLYHVLVLGFGPYLFDAVQAERVHRLGFWSASALLLGLMVGRLMQSRSNPAENRSPFQGPHRLHGLPDKSLRRLLLIPLALQAGVVALDVFRFGPEAYLSAAAQVGSIRTYASGGLDSLQLAKVAVDMTTVGFVATYFMACQTARSRVHWPLLLALMVVAPVLRLERGAVVVNVLSLMLIAALFGFDSGSSRLRRPGRLVVLACAGAFMLVVGLILGTVREEQLNPTASSTSASNVLQGEFSVVVMIDRGLGSPENVYGLRTVVGAMQDRLLPRRLFPDKRPNVTQQFMMQNYPDAFRSGFSLSPTGLGTMVLAGGTSSAVLFAGLVGLLIGKIPVTRLRSPRQFGLVCCTYLSLYSLLRNDLSNSLTQLLGSVLVFLLVQAVLSGPSTRKPVRHE